MTAPVRRREAQNVLAGEVRTEAVEIAHGNRVISSAEEQNARSPLLKSTISATRRRLPKRGRVKVDPVVNASISRVMDGLRRLDPNGQPSSPYLSKAKVNALEVADPEAGLALRQVYDTLIERNRAAEGPPTGSALVARLAALLRQPGMIGLPPSPVDFDHPNELSGAPIVKLVSGKTHANNFAAAERWMRTWWTNVYPDQTLEALDAADVAFGTTFAANAGTQKARDYLPQIVTEAHRDEVRELLRGFQGKVGFLQAYDVGAEIIGSDALVLTPNTGGKSLVIQIAYVHA